MDSCIVTFHSRYNSLDEGDTVSLFPAAAGPPAPAVTRSSIHRVPSVGSIGTLLTGCHPIIGVALIDNELIVLRKRQKDQIEFYDIEDNKLLRQRSVGGLNTDWWYNDLASCAHNQCLYISDFYNCCIHRITLEGAADRWTVVDKPRNLSVTAEHNLLITSRQASKLTEFTSAGELQRQVSLQSLPARPWHAVKLHMSDQFVVSYGFRGRAAQCYVSIVNADGQVIVHTYSGGQSNARLNEPYHVAVDCDGFIYVADYRNHRILMLSRTLDYVGHVVSRGLQGPYRMCLDAERRKLYVGQWNGQLTAIELLTNK